MKTPEILQAIQPVITVLNELSIPYYIGGSIASSMYGIARATMDVDMVADIKPCHVSTLKQLLEKDYYVDENMIMDAIKESSSFNLIHLKTMIKIDIFFQKADSYSKHALDRKKKDLLVEYDDASEFFFSSPEDVIINKLKWFEMTERTSERQWLDVIGVLKVQNTNLDIEYLKCWCAKLDLMSLLEAAFNDAGVKL